MKNTRQNDWEKKCRTVTPIRRIEMPSRENDLLIAWHKGELQNALLAIKKAIASYQPGIKKYPPRFADLYWHALRGEEIPQSVLTSDWNGGASLRTVDDFYGWMAKGSVEKLGLCSGAIYRSARYMAISPANRCGDRGKQTVHIEHTVPINVLFKGTRFRG